MTLMYLLPSPAAGEPTPTPPINDVGGLYRFEMIFDQGQQRAYGDSYSDLVSALIEGYGELDETDRDARRNELIVRAQVQAQAEICQRYDLPKLSGYERDILLGTKAHPQAIDEWTSSVPLILTAAFHQSPDDNSEPFTLAGEGHVIWLDSRDEQTFIESLASVDMISIAEI